MANKYDGTMLGRRTVADIEIDITDGTFATGNTILDLKCDLTELNNNQNALPVSALSTICGDKYTFADTDETVDTTDMVAIYTDGHAPQDVWEQLTLVKGKTVGVREWPRGKDAGHRYHQNTGVLTLVSPPSIPKSGGIFYNVQVAGAFTYGVS